MVDWVNPPGSIYCLYYMSGHLRLFTLRPRNYDYLSGCDQNRTGKYKNSGTRLKRQKTHKQENTDEKIENNYECRNLGK